MVHAWPSGFLAAVLVRPSRREQGVPCGTGSVGSPQLFRYASAAAWIAARVSRLSWGISSHFSTRVAARGNMVAFPDVCACTYVSASFWRVSRLHCALAFAAKATPAMTIEQNMVMTFTFSLFIVVCLPGFFAKPITGADAISAR